MAKIFTIDKRLSRRPIFRQDLRGRLRAFVDARDGSEDCFTLRRNGRAIDLKSTRDPSSEFTAAVLSSPRSFGRPSRRRFSRSRRARQGSRYARPAGTRASALTNRSVERGPGSYVMAGEDSVHHRSAMRKRTTSPGGRLMDLRTASAYVGCSYWTLRISCSTDTFPRSASRALVRVTAGSCDAS